MSYSIHKEKNMDFETIDLTLFRQLAPKSNRVALYALRIMADGTLRLNGHLCENLLSKGVTHLQIFLHLNISPHLSHQIGEE